MKYIWFALFIIKFTACDDYGRSRNSGNSSDSTISATPPVVETSKQDLDGCYMKITGRDTAVLMIEQKGNGISGKMLYDNFQKDGSRGTVKGKLEGDIIKLYYDFDSEGMHSVMEVYFKKVPGGLLRGIGDMDVKTDTAHFISGINYSDKEAFSKVDCDLVKNKFE